MLQRNAYVNSTDAARDRNISHCDSEASVLASDAGQENIAKIDNRELPTSEKSLVPRGGDQNHALYNDRRVVLCPNNRAIFNWISYNGYRGRVITIPSEPKASKLIKVYAAVIHPRTSSQNSECTFRDLIGRVAGSEAGARLAIAGVRSIRGNREPHRLR